MELAIPDPDTWYAAEGPFVTCWLPALEANEDPAHRLRLEWRHARAQVPGAPDAALEAIDALLGSERAHREAMSLLLVADPSGEVAGVHLADRPPAARAWCDALPRLAPALRARQQVVPHVVVVADRAGADIEVIDHAAELVGSVEGETTYIHRGHPGGWSQRRYQQRAENTWERNASGVAADLASVLERFTAARQTDGAADGPERTLAMLSQGRVAELLVHDNGDDERTAAFDRGSRQAGVDPAALTELGLTPTSGRLVDVALWAAHATGATVHLVPEHGPNVPSGSLGGLLRG